MSDKTLGKARGLNSIADPRDFKGAAGRRRRPSPDTGPPPPSPPPPAPGDEPTPTARRDDDTPERPGSPEPTGRGERAVDPSRPTVEGDRSDRAEPPDRQHRSTSQAPPADQVPPAPAAPRPPAPAESAVPARPHRAVTPGINRKRRELSVPHKIAEAVERTGINPADVVMSGYRNHSDAIYAGAGGRMAARGRTRLRLSISDAEFDQLTRLGQARGWNRSETVSVILALELLRPDPADAPTYTPT